MVGTIARLRGGRGLRSRLKRGGEGGADLNFDGDGGAGFGFVLGLKADDGVRGPGGSGRGGEMKLDFAAGGCGEGGGGQTGDLAQEFFQGFFVLGSDGFGGDAFRRGRSFAEELLGETGTGGGRQTQGHLAMDGASGDDRVPDVGIGGGQGPGRNFEDRGLSGDLGDHVLETGFPGFAPIAQFGPKFGGWAFSGRVGRS